MKKENDEYTELFREMLDVQAEHLAEEIKEAKQKRLDDGEDPEIVEAEFKKYEYTEEDKKEESRESLIETIKKKLEAFRDYIKSKSFKLDLKNSCKGNKAKEKILKNCFIENFLDKIACALGVTIVVSSNALTSAINFIAQLLNSLIHFAKEALLKILSVFNIPKTCN